MRIDREVIWKKTDVNRTITTVDQAFDGNNKRHYKTWAEKLRGILCYPRNNRHRDCFRYSRQTCFPGNYITSVQFQVNKNQRFNDFGRMEGVDARRNYDTNLWNKLNQTEDLNIRHITSNTNLKLIVLFYFQNSFSGLRIHGTLFIVHLIMSWKIGA